MDDIAHLFRVWQETLDLWYNKYGKDRKKVEQALGRLLFVLETGGEITASGVVKAQIEEERLLSKALTGKGPKLRIRG